MSNIENVSYADILRGTYSNDPNNTILIQIVDVGMDFPVPKESFKDVYQFRFMDLIDPTEINLPVVITDEQACDIVDILNFALKTDYDITVHCVAGLCRSGAIAEVGEIIGFNYVGNGKQPNSYVKRMLLEVIGYYDQWKGD